MASMVLPKNTSERLETRPIMVMKVVDMLISIFSHERLPTIVKIKKNW